MIITVPTAVSTRVRDEQVHPVQFSHPAPDIPADRGRFTHSDHEAAQECPPVLFCAPPGVVNAEDELPLRQNRIRSGRPVRRSGNRT